MRLPLRVCFSRDLYLRIGFLMAMGGMGVGFFITSETTCITPPAHVADPITVILGLFGKHTSLFLPTPDGRTQEYAFGDWDYFVLNQEQWWSGPRALLVSSASALGRRTLDFRTDDPRALTLLKEPDSLIFQVSAARAEAVRQMLDARFQSAIDTHVFNSDNNLDNVQIPLHYAMGINCNTVTVQWLRAMGCEVRGPALTSNFRLK